MTENNKTNSAIYIPSIEASDIYNHMHRGANLHKEYIGMIPESLELIELRNLKRFKEKQAKFSNLHISSDLINLKFDATVLSGEAVYQNTKQTIEYCKQKISELADENKSLSEDGLDKNKIKLNNESMEMYKSKLASRESELDYIKKNKDKWDSMNKDDLRKYFYENGFTITEIDQKTKKEKQVSYRVYKRSAGKSRNGQRLFIKEELHGQMISWSRMGLDIKQGTPFDLSSLFAYESLVSSSIIGKMEIDPYKILLVSDVESVFQTKANTIHKGQDGFLTSTEGMGTVRNSLFDGESLLQDSPDYFPEGKNMALLRAAMFKSCAFRTDIQQFLKDKHKEKGIDVPFEEWTLPDMFGKEMLAKDIHMITTPSSVKALKFADLAGGKSHMWDFFRQWTKQQGSIWGICKHEKRSKLVDAEDGTVMQRTSYQMINSMPFTQEELREVLKYEKEYINSLKANGEMFIKHLKASANDLNANNVWIDLYNRNSDIQYFERFKAMMRREISEYQKNIPQGTIRIPGDYLILLGNGYELLLHAIGELDTNDPQSATLHKNEVYTDHFEFEQDLVGFRNPHTSPNNVLRARNTYNELIDKYFSIGKNIVYVNSISFALADTLSGSDFDSDSALFTSCPTILEVAERCKEYLPCIRDIEPDGNTDYILNDTDAAKLDTKLSKSQNDIGKTVNTGQYIMSRYWDLINKGEGTQEELDELRKGFEVTNVLSGICIDMAKKQFDLNISKEINKLRKSKALQVVENGKKDLIPHPRFWEYVDNNNCKKKKTMRYACPMDYLQDKQMIKDGIERKEHTNQIKGVEEFLESSKIKGANRKQRENIQALIVDMSSKIDELYANKNKRKSTSEEDEKEDKRLHNLIIKETEGKIAKWKIKPDTMRAALIHADAPGKSFAYIIKMLHKYHKDQFLEMFKKKMSH